MTACLPCRGSPHPSIDFGQVEAAVRGNNPCFPVSRLVTVENTHAQRGGKVLPIEFLDNLAVLAQVRCGVVGLLRVVVVLLVAWCVSTVCCRSLVW